MKIPSSSYLNIGCGDIFDASWTNIDLVSNSEHVRSCNIKKGLPFDNESFEVVYHSHILEHLKPSEVKLFLTEIKRVLKPNGILRLVVPDLELLAKAYLETLSQSDVSKHEWVTIELFDQMTRVEPGGLMAGAIVGATGAQREFIKSRIGLEAEKIWSEKPNSRSRRFLTLPFKVLRKIQKIIAECLVFLVGGCSFRSALREGLFRQSGEIHQWAYDRVSVKRLLTSSGFISISVKNAFESEIPNFNSFALDSFQDQVRKPDSLFVECRRGL